MKEAKNFIGEGKMAIEFTGRELSELEENVLIDLIRLHSNLNIVYVFSGEKIKELNYFSLFHSVSEEGPTKFFRGTLRSGSQLEYDGNLDRKSTRLNSSHANISYAVFCLKKKKD